MPVATDDDSVVERQWAKWRREKDERLACIQSLITFDETSSMPSAAIRGRSGTGPRDQARMAVISGELSDLSSGRYRVTFFGPDGPHGHATRKTIKDVVAEIEDSMSPPFEAMTDEQVIEWTTTPEFEIGSRLVAYVQAENTFRYMAQRAGKIDWAYQIIREVGEEAGPRPHSAEVIDRATERLVEAMRTLPTPNPAPRGRFVRNPPWVTGALAGSYGELEKILVTQPGWMPVLTGVRARGSKVIAELAEYGCGKYGCVLPTLNPKVVLKVTTDETEAMFADKLEPGLAAPICVLYQLVAELSATHEGEAIYLLWREAADHVGKLADQLGAYADQLVYDQHQAAQRAYDAVYHHHSETMIRARVSFWLEMCERIARQVRVPELRPLGAGLIEVYERQQILFGDIHAGNLGLVTRGGIGSWVITDPGNVAVIDDL